MNIFLIGFMGSGKTTAGQKLASLMNYQYMDLDDVIEQKEKDSIRNIFAKKGEQYFRKQEKKYLQVIASGSRRVISPGGGAPCHSDNMEFMNKHGITVYLKMKPEELYSRLKNEKSERPLIRGKSDQELLEFIRQKLSEREPYYKQAQWTVKGYNLNVRELYNKIFRSSEQ